MNRPIVIVQLYSQDMNVYGDNGNVQAIMTRLEHYGYQPQLIKYNPGDPWPGSIDLIVGGGGQDAGQTTVSDDLKSISHDLIKLAEQGTPMLMICGLYQLFGHRFTAQDESIIPGIGLLDITTVATNKRIIGNLTVKSSEFGDLIGFENHSGQTTLGSRVKPLGSVGKHQGNNGNDGTEGARYHNVIGSYLHGPIIPKNPQLADFLIKTAATQRYGAFEPTTELGFDDTYAKKARAIAMTRPR